ncbi:MAG: hypothetical protein M9962_15260 [Oligoflexia bacterium]|nr:hypothetical protein [Oligoflexia bacterium]
MLGCSGLTGREPAQLTRLKITKVPHVIFLIHGFRDDGSSFQDLPEILSAKYKDENIRVKLLKYPAVSDSAEALEMSSYDFAKIINAQIINYLIEQNSADINDSLFEYSHPVDLSTQFTVVAHSQGGLVTMNFLNSCLMSINDLKKQVDERCKYQEGIDLLKRIGLENYLVRLFAVGSGMRRASC